MKDPTAVAKILASLVTVPLPIRTAIDHVTDELALLGQSPLVGDLRVALNQTAAGRYSLTIGINLKPPVPRDVTWPHKGLDLPAAVARWVAFPGVHKSCTCPFNEHLSTWAAPSAAEKDETHLDFWCATFLLEDENAHLAAIARWN